MSLELYLAYVLACILITIIPGPTVTLIIANSLTHGMRAGLSNAASMSRARSWALPACSACCSSGYRRSSP